MDGIAQVNGHKCNPDISFEKSSKRRKRTEEDIPSQNEVRLERNKEKMVKTSEECLQRDTKHIAHDKKDSQRKHTEKKKKKRAEENVPIATPKPTATTKRNPTIVKQPVKSTKKPITDKSKAQTVSSSDSRDSSSEEEEAPKTMAAQKEAPKIPTPTPVRVPQNTKLSTLKSHSTLVSFSSSSETDSSSEATSKNRLPKCTSAPESVSSTTPKGTTTENSDCQRALSSLQSTDCLQSSVSSLTSSPAQNVLEQPQFSNSNGEEEIELVIRRPIQQLGHSKVIQSSWQGPGWRNDVTGGCGSGGRGRGERRGAIEGHSGNFGLSYDDGQQAKQQMKHNDSLTNNPVVLQVCMHPSVPSVFMTE